MFATKVSDDQNPESVVRRVVTSIAFYQRRLRGLPINKYYSVSFTRELLDSTYYTIQRVRYLADQWMVARMVSATDRYADDFILLSHEKETLRRAQGLLSLFLWEKLKLELHPDKIFLKTFASGVDFLGWAHFPNHRVLRTTTKRRMMRRLNGGASEATLQSYFGLLRHGNTHKIQEKIKF